MPSYKDLLVSMVAAAVFFAPARPLKAQGCIVARSSSLTSGPESQGGYLMPGPALNTAGSTPMPPVVLGRFKLGVAL